ncbi:hypothetical protein M0R45_014433 [Rubus argutus]|uniref:Disease resistance R13L4/SHOC-2-like LRR domain-containing protein n=1 Tax=Rubus argutus TaxID=59490 RepID=A0AAW1XM90_RUBAR
MLCQKDCLGVNGLSWQKGWSLFCKKAFKKTAGYCPPELEEWANKILKKCEGLPLAVSAIATLLAKKPQTPVEWKKLHESLGAEIRPQSSLSIISHALQPRNFITVLEPNCSNAIDSGEKIRRLSVQNVNMNLLKSRGTLSHIRTLLVFGEKCSPSELEKVLEGSKLLRVLDLQSVPLKEFPDSAIGLSLLRYLNLSQTEIKSVPKSIGNLVFLQTLDLTHTLVTNLPKTIYKLQEMRNLLVYSCDETSGAVQGVELLQEISELCLP